MKITSFLFAYVKILFYICNVINQIMMSMITRDEYIKALILIDEYHQQNKGVEIKGIPIGDIIRLNISARLKNVLIQLETSGVEYINEVYEYNFKRIRNGGDVSWKEFEEIKKKYLDM